jgi:hypothetical protein
VTTHHTSDQRPGGPRLFRLPIALLLAFSLALVSTPSASAEDPPPDSPPVATPADPSSPPPGGSLIILPDPKVWAGEVFAGVLTGLLDTINGALRLVVSSADAGALNFITTTPPAGSYANGTVQSLWGTCRAVANAALVLVALAAGYSVIVAEGHGTPYRTALEVIPRLVLGALLVNTSLIWAQLAIDLNNALCGAVGSSGLAAWDQSGAGGTLPNAVATLAYLIASLLLVIQMLMRLALVDVMLVVAPIALLCWVLPWTQQWARLWSTTFLAAVFCQFLQVVAMKLGASLIGDSAAIGSGAGLLRLFLGIAVIALTLRIPTLLRTQTGGGLGLVRQIAFVAATRGAAGRSRTRGSAARGGA